MTMNPNFKWMIHALAGVMIVFSAQADTKTWSASATTTSWALGSNWVGGVAPVAGDDVVVFGRSAGGAFSPTENLAYTNVTLHSLTLKDSLDGNINLTLSRKVKIGAGGLSNGVPATAWWYLNDAVELTEDQTWSSAGRPIDVVGAFTGAKLTWSPVNDTATLFFRFNSTTWTSGLDVRGSVEARFYNFTGGSTITPFGVGNVTMINQKSNASTASSPTIALDSGVNTNLATAYTLPNNIILSDMGTTGNFNIRRGQNSDESVDAYFFILAGNITGSVNSSRTLTFSSAQTKVAQHVLTGTNTYSAQTVIATNVVLRIGNNGTSGTLGTGAITVNNGGKLAFNRSDTLMVSNVISGVGQVIQLGSGTTLLTGTNNFTAGMTVSNGTLWACNTAGSATGTNRVNVFSGATLGGIGMITGVVNVASGGYLKPGTNSIGTLTVGGLALASGATYAMQVGGVGSCDRCVVTKGAIDVTGSTLSVSFENSYVPTPGDSFTIIRNIPGTAVTGRFTNDTDFKVSSIPGVFSIKYTGGAGQDVVLHYKGILGTCICIQ
ncbi:MAG: hypothetical protein WCP12_16540 [bacterium]